MRRPEGMIVVLLVAASFVAACSRAPSEEGAEGTVSARVEPIEGTDLARVILSAEAADRLDVQTAEVRRVPRATGAERLVVPYGAVLYDPSGDAWVYTSPEPLVFVRAPIAVTRIRQGRAYLSSGPPVGTSVVTVAASELLGTEYEVGEE